MANNTLICHSYGHKSRGIWHSSNILEFPTTLLVFQLSLISLATRMFDLCLQPLGQSIMISQILGGLVLGPSLLGHKEEIATTLFPVRSHILLETLGCFGFMFFIFAVGVKMNATAMMQPGRNAIAIGLSIMVFATLLPVLVAVLMVRFIPMEKTMAKSLPFIAGSQSLTAFPVMVCLLTELKLVNTDLGRLALSTSMFCDIIGLVLMVLSFIVSDMKADKIVPSLGAILSTMAFVGVILCLIRPAILWLENHVPDGKHVDENYVLAVLILVPLTGIVSEIVGQHFALGPFILGLVVPDGPPLGAAVTKRVDTLVSVLLYPTFLAVSGMKTNIFTIQSRSVWVVAIVVLFSLVVKIVAVMIPALYMNMPLQQSFVLALILNARGFIEIMIFNLWKQSEFLSDEGFAVSVISVIIVTAIITPLIRLLFDPSKHYVALNRSTIQQVRHKAEFKILVSIRNQDNVPAVINLLEISHASEESPIVATAIILLELVGRAAPVFISHHQQQQRQRSLTTCGSSSSGRIINAFEQYEQQNQGFATVETFTSMSHFEIMHEDICRLALEKKANLVIVPFHKQWAIDGRVGSVNRAIQSLNINVLERAPCSVGILVDREVLHGASSSIRAHRSLYRVSVIFIGGADDAESLAYGARMVNHQNVYLTVVRFLLFRNENTKDRKRETELVDEYRRANMGSNRFVYMEEVVRDGEGLAAFISEMVSCFDLIIVGRHHQRSPLLQGLEAWSECPELGIVGDMLASPDFGSTASVLVVQQHRIGRNLTIPMEVNDRDDNFLAHHKGPYREPTRPEEDRKGSEFVTLDIQ